MKTIGDSDITDIPSVEKRQSPASVPLIAPDGLADPR